MSTSTNNLDSIALGTLATFTVGTVASTLALRASMREFDLRSFPKLDPENKIITYGAIALGSLTGAVTAVTAWCDPASKDGKSYVKTVIRHYGPNLPVAAAIAALALLVRLRS